MTDDEQPHNAANNPDLYGFVVEPGSPDLNRLLRLNVRVQKLVDAIADVQCQSMVDALLSLEKEYDRISTK